MSSSQFDPEAFLSGTIAEPSVRRPPLPAGKVFPAVIGEVKAIQWTGKKDPTQSGVRLDVPLEIDLSGSPDIVAALGGITKVVLTDGVMLATTPNGAIDNSPGKNARLRGYREALNMNNPGDVFSPRQMQGRMVNVKIKHEVYEGEILDKVESVAKF